MLEQLRKLDLLSRIIKKLYRKKRQYVNLEAKHANKFPFISFLRISLHDYVMSDE